MHRYGDEDRRLERFFAYKSQEFFGKKSACQREGRDALMIFELPDKSFDARVAVREGQAGVERTEFLKAQERNDPFRRSWRDEEGEKR